MGMGLYLSKSCKQLSATDAAYLAGILDGEGSISISCCTRRGRLKTEITVGIANNCGPLLDWIAEVTGVGGLYRAKRGHLHRSAWNLAGFQASVFLKQLIPYLRIKKEQAALAVQFCETKSNRRQGKYRLSNEVMSLRLQMRDEMLTLNKRYKFGG